MSGSTNENYLGPDFLLQKDIVFVTIGYRLGALGICEVAINGYLAKIMLYWVFRFFEHC